MCVCVPLTPSLYSKLFFRLGRIFGRPRGKASGREDYGTLMSREGQARGSLSGDDLPSSKVRDSSSKKRGMLSFTAIFS